MSRRFVILVSLVLALVLGLTVSAGYAYDHGKAKGHGEKGLDEKFFHRAHFILKNEEELALSAEQVKKIKDLKMKTKKDLIKIKAEIEIIALDIKAQLWGDTIDEKAVNDLIDKKYDLKKSKAKFLVAACISLKSILTEEQKVTLKTIMKKCKTEKD